MATARMAIYPDRVPPFWQLARSVAAGEGMGYTPPMKVLLSAVAGGMLMLTACSEQRADAPSDQILRLIHEQPASLVLETLSLGEPTLELGWGQASISGWVGHGERTPQGLGVRAKSQETALFLEAASAANRTIEIEAWDQAGGRTVALEINGNSLGVIQLTEKHETFSIHAPASVWELGFNELRMRASDEQGGWFVGRIDVDPNQMYAAQERRLDSGASVAWDFFAGSPGLLDVTVKAKTESGHAIVQLARMVPGALSTEVLEERVVDVQQDVPAEQRFLFDDPEGELLRLTILWNSPSSAGTLEVESIGLMENEPLKRPSILFLSIDTLAAMNMSTHGYARDTTPNLRAFLDDAIAFPQARSNAPWTVPSYSSQFTGLYMNANRMPEELRQELDVPFGPREFRLGPSRWTLGKLFAGAGYRTAAYIDNLWLEQLSGLRQGFEVFDSTAIKLDRGAPYTFSHAADFLVEHRGQPTFVFAHTFDVHGPYQPNAPFEGTFTEPTQSGGEDMLSLSQSPKELFFEVPNFVLGKGSKDPSAMVSANTLRTAYDEQILEVDAAIGKLFEDLRARGLYDDLMIVVSADHGESMDDHAFYFRHGIVYDSAIRVPLLIKMPKQQHGGARVEQAVQLVDLLPTFTDLLGLPLKAVSHGQSLVPALKGEKLPQLPVLSQATLLDHSALIDGNWKYVRWYPRAASTSTIASDPYMQKRLSETEPELFEELFGKVPLLTGDEILGAITQLKEDAPNEAWSFRMKLMDTDPFELLFDLSVDPHEERDVLASHPDIAARMRALMDQEIARAMSARSFSKGPVMQISEAVSAELQALGYVED